MSKIRGEVSIVFNRMIVTDNHERSGFRVRGGKKKERKVKLVKGE